MKILVETPISGEVVHDDTALVLLNHLGSYTGQDTGRDAQAYADALGVPVLAADRPGTAGLVPHPALARSLATAPGYVEQMARVGKAVDKQLDSLGIKRTIIVGRSAGGLGALALTRTETIASEDGLFVAEPVGCEPMGTAEGARRFKEYGAHQKTLQESGVIKPDNGTLPKREAIPRVISIVPAFFYDKYHNKYIWATDAAIQYLQDIATRQSIDVVAEFAEHSLVAAPEIYAERLSKLNGLRENFVVRQSMNTSHASYDDHRFMTSLLAPIVAKS